MQALHTDHTWTYLPVSGDVEGLEVVSEVSVAGEFGVEPEKL